MSDRNSFTVVGRNLLIGVAFGTLPIVGCAQFDPLVGNNVRIIRVPAAEKSSYEEAKAARNAVQTTEFLNAYPSSELIPSLLASMPAPELRRIPRSSIRKVDPDILNELPAWVKRQIGLLAPVPVRAVRDNSDGYSG